MSGFSLSLSDKEREEMRARAALEGKSLHAWILDAARSRRSWIVDYQAAVRLARLDMFLEHRAVLVRQRDAVLARAATFRSRRVRTLMEEDARIYDTRIREVDARIDALRSLELPVTKEPRNMQPTPKGRTSMPDTTQEAEAE